MNVVTDASQRSLDELSEATNDDEDAAVAKLEQLLGVSDDSENADCYRAPGDGGNKLA